jgi:hypothetical protein
VRHDLGGWKDAIAPYLGASISIEEELAILCWLADTLIKNCKTPEQLGLQAPRIESLVGKIIKSALEFYEISKERGQLMDQSQSEFWADRMVEIVAKHVTDPDLLFMMSDEIIEVLPNVDDNAHRAPQSPGPGVEPGAGGAGADDEST